MRSDKKSRSEHIATATSCAFDQLIDDGEAYVSVSITDVDVLSAMRAEIKRRASILHGLNLFLPHGKDEGWRNVKRATYFGEKHREHLPFRRQVLARAFSSRALPETVKVANDIAAELRRKSLESSIPEIRNSSLSTWTPNRFGINRLDGTKEDSAVIAEHKDVKTELGTVVVFEIASGNLDAAVSIKNNVTFIFSKDICDLLDIEQPLHGQETDHYRLSLTIAELNPAIT
jgi:hypothetical protein